MISCHDMKKGEVYVCGDCGIELQVIRECQEAGTAPEDCACHADGNPCTFSCCGKELQKKTA